MSHKHKFEEHENHEAWAIPYGDLVTLLLAFFVVMYSMSTVNEGKYRILSDSLKAAFRGSPRSLDPIQVGTSKVGQAENAPLHVIELPIDSQVPILKEDVIDAPLPEEVKPEHRPSEKTKEELAAVADKVEESMADLVDTGLVAVRRHDFWVEVEIRADILFPSGSATLSHTAVEALQQLADTLKEFPNPMRVEGHTDNRPINTAVFPSNWELSAARAGSVVQLFTQRGIDPQRLAVIGLGEYRPAQDNSTEQGRNANRRVLIVILSGEGDPEGAYAAQRGKNETTDATDETAIVDDATDTVEDAMSSTETQSTQAQPASPAASAATSTLTPPADKAITQ